MNYLQYFYAVLGMGLLATVIWLFIRFLRSNESTSRYSVGWSLGAFILSFLSFLPALINLFKDKKLDDATDQLGVVFGIIFMVASGVVVAIVQQKDFAEKVTNELGSKLDSNQEFLSFHQALNKDDWRKEVIQMFLSMLRNTERNVHIRTELRDQIKYTVKKWSREAEHPSRIEYPYDDEEKRMKKLKVIVHNAKLYVNAVTYDEGTYLKDFWAGILGREYLTVNEEQASRITRIFVLGRDVLNGDDLEKQTMIQDIINAHLNASIAFRLICKDDLPERWKSNNPATSFLVCDGDVASESYCLTDREKKINGYIAFNDTTTADHLKSRFDELKSFKPSSLNNKSRSIAPQPTSIALQSHT